MNFTCNECNDTGSRDKLGTYLDCNACHTAATRRGLNDFVKSLTQRSTYPTHPEDVALAIHQRALAMAPKREAPEPVYQDCGACNGSGWVSRDADIGTEQECFSCYGSGKSDDAAPTISTASLTEEQVVCALGCIANGRNAGYISTENAKVVREFIRAAPAAANGTLPELPKPETMIVESDIGHRAYTADQMRAYGQACAAAGPDAALIELIQKHWNGAYFQGVTKAEAREINEVLALSGAKGN